MEAIREGETASEDKKELEPEKEKNPRNQDEEARLEYYSMAAASARRLQAHLWVVPRVCDWLLHGGQAVQNRFAPVLSRTPLSLLYM